jgi:hypothetical protein
MLDFQVSLGAGMESASGSDGTFLGRPGVYIGLCQLHFIHLPKHSQTLPHNNNSNEKIIHLNMATGKK